LFHNSNVFGSCIIHILYTGVLKLKNNSGTKRLILFRDVWGNVPVAGLLQARTRATRHQNPSLDCSSGRKLEAKLAIQSYYDWRSVRLSIRLGVEPPYLGPVSVCCYEYTLKTKPGAGFRSGFLERCPGN